MGHQITAPPGITINEVVYLALAVAVGSGDSYALAATASNGTIAVWLPPTRLIKIKYHARCWPRQLVGPDRPLDLERDR
jgi:hypothetical protein